MDKRRLIINRLAAALALALLTGCTPGENPSGIPQNNIRTVQASAEATSSAAETEPTSDISLPQSDYTEEYDSSEISVTAESLEITQQTELPETAEVSAEQSSEPLVTEQCSEEVPVATSAPATSASTAPITTAATTAPPEPVKIVIPEVKVPLSPGIDIVSNDKAVVDYSNASEGYISVCWNDTGKRVKLRITFGEKVYDHDVSTGGVTEYFPLSCGSGVYKVQLYEQTEGDKYAKSLEQEFTAKITNETSPFLYPNKYVNFSSKSAAVAKAAEVCAGKTDTIEKLAAIFQWITDNVTYDKELAATVQSGYVPDPDSVLKKKTGICYDYSSLLAAMTRSQEIPTRLVVGYAATNIYHAWNEVYTEETGWITPELLLSKHGYNIMDSTFYAGSSDKEKIADYISNNGNYSALYYY